MFLEDIQQALDESQADPRIITQRQIRILQKGRRLKSQIEKLRKDLRQRYDDGATVEQGRLTLRTAKTFQQRLSRRALELLLGEAEASDLIDRIEPTEFVRLMVEESKSFRRSKGQRRRQRREH